MANIELRRVWIIDDAADKKDGFPRRIWDLIEAKQAPELRMAYQAVNMWWRKDSPVIALTSSLEKTAPFNGFIYVQDYGRSLLIGRAVVEPDTLNRFKWMAAAAFEHLIDSAINEIVEAEKGGEITVRGEKSTDTST